MTPQLRSKYKKISTFGTCSQVGGWRPLDSSEWTQFWPNYSQLHADVLPYLLYLLTLYLVHLKVQVRSQKVTRILESLTGHETVTHVSWSTLVHELIRCVDVDTVSIGLCEAIFSSLLSDKVESVPTWRLKIGTTLVMIERMAHVFQVWRMAGFVRFCVREAGNPRRSVYELRSSSFCKSVLKVVAPGRSYGVLVYTLGATKTAYFR